MKRALSELVGDLVTLVQSQTFWTALGALGALITLYYIYRQVSAQRTVAAYTFLREENNRFESEDMRRVRSNLARVLLTCPRSHREIEWYAEDVCNFFEDLGLILKKRIAPEYFVWTMFSDHIRNYWAALKDYIQSVRVGGSDPTYYCEFEYLDHRIRRLEKKMTRKKDIEPTADELRDFLEGELDIEVRHCSRNDLDRIMDIETSSFTVDAYSRSQFEELHKKYPEGIFVAVGFGQVIGYVIGYTYDTIGEIDSLAVDPNFRELGIGKRLTQHVLAVLNRRGAKSYSLEVRTTNSSAIRLYKGFGFTVSETLGRYYDDGADAYVMRAEVHRE